jgi:tRNA A37 threonylcarbamoyltransferase TsaD
MKAAKLPILWLLLAGAAVPLVGCEEGPLEEAGEEVDDAVDDAGDAIDRRN